MTEPFLALQLEQELGCHPTRYHPRAIAQRRIRTDDVNPFINIREVD